MQKKAKDSGASGPKKSLSAYFWFCAEQRPIMNEKFPDSSMTDKTKKMSAIWNALTDEKKKKYQDLADKDKARYERQKKQFEDTGAFKEEVVGSEKRKSKKDDDDGDVSTEKEEE